MKILNWQTKQSLKLIAPIFVFLMLFGGLEIIVNIFDISRRILPPPSNIIYVLLTRFRGALFLHFTQTLKVIIIGFFVGVPTGIILAAIVSQFKIIERAFSPYVIMLVTTPFITLVPIFMLWLGFGIRVRIMAVILQTIPIVMLNSISGFNKIEQVKLDLMNSLGSTKIQKFLKVIFPNALPQVFTGIKLGGIFATIAAVSAEFAGARDGLGNRIIYYSGFVETELAYSCILLIAMIGITLYFLIASVEKRIIKWKK